ncbi:MAG: DUF4258 domain-containing protein [Chloroflexota bacterium]
MSSLSARDDHRLVLRIQEAVRRDRWALTTHARERAGKRLVGDEDLVHIIANGEIVEHYPDDPRGPSALVLGHTSDARPLHAVCAFDWSGTLLVITVYEPTPPKWLDQRTRSPREEKA